MALDYEVILHQIGGFGRHQLFLHVWNQLSLIVLTGTMGFMAFGGAGPNPGDEVSQNVTDISSSNYNFSFYSIAAEWDLVDGYAYIVATITVNSRNCCYFAKIYFNNTVKRIFLQFKLQFFSFLRQR